MKIRRFVADDMQGALNQVKNSFGSDALILQTRYLRRGGFLGLFGRRLVEVTAAIENKEPQANERQRNTPSETRPSFPTRDGKQTENSAIEEKLQDLKTMLDRMVTNFESAAVANGNGYPAIFQHYYRILRANEVEEGLVRQILDEAMRRSAQSPTKGREDVKRLMEEITAEYFLKPAHPSLRRDNGTKRVIALVGPTGVGKTTTVAKLAAQFSLLEKKNVALVTLDTYRVAAAEQLKTYADLMAIPFEIASTPKQFQEILRKHEEKEMILVDTAGRSPLNKIAMAKLKLFMDACPDMEILLVMGATTKQADLWEIASRFGQLNVKQLIFTKLDETLKYGVILNAVNRMQKNLAYITTGQDVPDDIEEPEPARLASSILREEQF
jgi:flagellar biosynthesis protein FlhF